MQVLVTYFKQYWYALVLLVIGLHSFFFQYYGYDLKYMIGDMGDARFIASIVEYNYQWLIGNYDKYWDGFFMYGDKEVISYSDNLLGSLPLYALIRCTGIHFLTAFQLLILLFHVLNFSCAHFFFKKTTQNKYAAATGAFIFAFSIMLMGVYNYPQFVFRFCIPLFFYFFQRYLTSKKSKDLFWSIFFLVFQFYLGVYIGYFLLFFAFIYFVSYFIFTEPRPSFVQLKNQVAQLIVGFVVFLLGLMPIMYFYYKRKLSNGYYTSYDEVLETVPHISSYLKSFPDSFSWQIIQNTSINSKYGWFHFLFPGGLVFIAIVFSIYLVIKKNNKTLYLILLSTLLLFLVLTTEYNKVTLYKYMFDFVPGFKAIRVVSRIVIVAIFFGAWLVSLNLTYVFTNLKKKSYVVIFMLPLILFLDNYVSPKSVNVTQKQITINKIIAIKAKLKKHPNYKNYRVFAYIPYKVNDPSKIQIDAMLAAVYLKMKTINGYSSSCSGKFGLVWSKCDSESVSNWCKDANINIESILVIR